MDYSPFSGRSATTWMSTSLPEQSLHSQDERSPQRNEAVGEVMLGASEDVSALSPTLSNAVQPHSFYTSVPSYYHPSTFSYGIQSYGQQAAQWNHLPVSTYSSLNGATTSQSMSQSQQSSPPVQHAQSPVLQHHSPPMQHSPPPQQQSPPQQQYQASHISPTQTHISLEQVPSFDLFDGLKADACLSPSLMLSPFTQTTTQSPNNYVSTNYFYGNPTQTLSLSPSLLHAPSHSPPAQTSQPSQQAIQPQQQHHLQTQFQSSSSPAVASASPSGPSKATLVNILNGLLSAKSLPSSPAQIIQTLTSIGASEVDLPDRLKVLSKIRDNAGNDFYQAWASNMEGMDIIREWLKAAVVSKSGEWDETVMPLLHVIDRLPLTIESLKAAKLGKVVMKLKEITSSSAVKDMASNLESRWRDLAMKHDRAAGESAAKKSEGKISEDARLKKRKAEEAASSKVPPTKKIAVARPVPPLAKPVVVKKEAKPAPAVKDAKSDSSFFSAPKPKPKLPSFKKAPVKKETGPDPNVAQPSAVDPFKDALAAMTKPRSSPTPVPMEAKSTPPPPVGQGGTPLKKKKRVSFKPEDQLVQVKFIERAIYDDDVANGVSYAHNIRDLDRDEGAALHKHIFEEQIDWTEPLPLELPEGLDRPKGEGSLEKITQEEREKSALTALYMAGQIPDSPAEPSHQIPEDEVDSKVKHMLSGNDVRELDRENEALSSKVGNLISQLGGVLPSVPPNDQAPAPAIPQIDLKSLGLDMSVLAQLAAQTQQQTGAPATTAGSSGANDYSYPQPPGAPAQPSSSYMGDGAWNNNQYNEYGGSYEEEGGQRPRSGGWDGHGSGPADQNWRGRGGRGGGGGGGRGKGGYRGTKRKLCNFYAQGRCRYGDQCDFLHEP